MVGKQLAEIFYIQFFYSTPDGRPVDLKAASFIEAAGLDRFDKKSVAQFLRETADQLDPVVIAKEIKPIPVEDFKFKPYKKRSMSDSLVEWISRYYPQTFEACKKLDLLIDEPDPTSVCRRLLEYTGIKPRLFEGTDYDSVLELIEQTLNDSPYKPRG